MTREQVMQARIRGDEVAAVVQCAKAELHLCHGGVRRVFTVPATGETFVAFACTNTGDVHVVGVERLVQVVATRETELPDGSIRVEIER